MTNECTYDEDRLTGEQLTADEQEALRERAARKIAFARRYFRLARRCGKW